MSLSDNYPDIRPLWMNDYASAGVIDPRCSFTRSDSTPSNVHYWSDEDHVSSENLLLQSSNFDTTWVAEGLLSTPSGGQTDPSGSTGGWRLTEGNTTDAHRVKQQDLSASGTVAYTVYAKQNSGSRALMLKLFNTSTDWVVGVFDLAGGAALTTASGGSNFTSVSVSQTSSGNGYYKCVIKATGTVPFVSIALKDAADTSGLSSIGKRTYSGDGSSSLDIAFASLTSTGATDYQPTTTQIHREYAATLKPVSYSGQPRFEYEPSGDRSAKGLLIESSVSNVMPFSTNGYNASNSFVWSSNYIGAKQNAAIAPSGNLEATLIHEDGTTNQHNFYRTITGTAAPYTYSIYVKDAGVGSVGFRLLGPSSYGLNFNLSDGSTSTFYNTVEGYGFEDVGNGWKRIWVTKTLTAASWHMMIYLTRGGVNYAGDNYSGVLWYGAMIEQSSFPSSYIDTGTSGSASTRTRDQLSIDDSSLFSGNEGTVVFEGQTLGGSTGFGRFWSVSDGTNDNRIHVYPTSSTVVRFRVYRNGIEQRNVATTVTDVTENNRYAFTYEDNKLRLAQNGSLLRDDSNSAVMPMVNKLSIGMNPSGSGNQMNGYVKRIAFYNESLTDTELQSLTS